MDLKDVDLQITSQKWIRFTSDTSFYVMNLYDYLRTLRVTLKIKNYWPHLGFIMTAKQKEMYAFHATLMFIILNQKFRTNITLNLKDIAGL